MKYIFLFCTLLAPSLCFSQTYIKNGYPCVSELCIGDSLSELKKISFKKLENKSRKPSPQDVAEVAAKYVGKIDENSALYLRREVFDLEALDALSGISAFCENDRGELVGKYITQGGNNTDVHIRLLPINENSTEQKWTVVKILRFIQTPMTQEDIKRSKFQLDERYKIFNTEDEQGYQKTSPTNKGAYTFSDFTSYFTFSLQYSSPSYNLFNREIKFPSTCKKSVNLE